MVARLVTLLTQWARIWSQSLGQSSARRRIGRIHADDAWRTAAQIELLEPRSLLSAANVLTSLHANTTYEVVNAATPASSVSYSPSQIQAAYGFNKISNNGSGQTIAIVDAYNDPTI